MGGEIKKEREVSLRKEFALFVLESPYNSRGDVRPNFFAISKDQK